MEQKRLTKAQVNDLTSVLNSEQQLKFCPIIKHNCRQDCVSYGHPWVNTGYTAVNPASCDAFMLTGGTVYVER